MAIYNGRILMRKGNEADFDASKLMSGEWAVSLDAGIVRICLEAGKVIRMATYEAFEEDMKQVEAILLECKSIEEAVRRINTEVSEKLNACAEYVQQAKNYSEQAKTSEANAKSYMQSAKTSEENAKVSETNAKASENSAKEYENSAKLTEERAREVFESIPEDYSTISNDLYELAIKETASGEEIYVNDSSNLKLREFALYGKAKQNTTIGNQLFNYDAWKNIAILNGTAVFENNGITITASVDNCYTEYKTNVTKPYPQETYIQVSEGDILTLSWEEDTNKQGRIYIFPNGGTNGSVNTNNNKNKKLSYTVTSGVSFVTFRFGVQYAGDTIAYKNIMINKGSEPLPYEQYTGGMPSPNPQYPQPIEVSGASGSVEVKSCGKNLLKIENTTKIKDGITWTAYDDGHIVANGTASDSCVFDIPISLKDGITYVASGVSGGSLDTYHVFLQKAEGLSTSAGYFGNGEKTFTKDSDKVNVGMFRCRIASGYTANNLTFYPMIRLATDTDSTFEPYKETLSTIPTENGLAGIKVSSGGNYTDENGQQWICDEIVKYADGSGEDIQRFATVVFDGSDDEEWQDRTNDYTNKKDGQTRFSVRVDKPYDASREICAMSNICYQGQIQGAPAFSKEGIALYTLDGTSTSTICYVTLNNPNVTDLATFKSWLSNNNIVLVYELATPIRTPLTAEEIAEIEKLHTFYPITNISNDADCGMSVTYYADSKNYIDKKISELATAMVNNI